MLNNKFAYQMSLIAYAIAQMMNANGYDATDALAVSAFVGNLSNSVLQKVIDKATTAEAQAGTNTLKWMTPALVKSFFDYRLAAQAEAQVGSIDTKWMSPAKVKAFYNYWKATASEATEGTNDTKWMSPLKVAQAVAPVVNASWVLKQAYTTAGSYTWTAPDLFNGRDYTIGVMVIGGGASGTAYVANTVAAGTIGASGGPSGYSAYTVLKITPGSSYALVVGAGGAAVSANRKSSGTSFTIGNGGSSSSFGGFLIANGGFVYDSISATYGVGGQPAILPSNLSSAGISEYVNLNLFGGVYLGPLLGTKSDGLLSYMDVLSCYNPFEQKRMLGAGGFGGVTKVTSDGVSTYTHYLGKGGKDAATGLGSPDGEVALLTATGSVAASGVPTAPGCGGCGMLVYCKSSISSGITAISGAGADGAVMIYVMGVEA